MIRLMQAFRDARFEILVLYCGWFFLNPVLTGTYTYSGKTLSTLLVESFSLFSIVNFLILSGIIITLKYLILRYLYPNQN